MATKHFCDFCDKEMKRINYAIAFENRKSIGIHFVGASTFKNYTLDLCTHCGQGFMEQIESSREDCKSPETPDA